MKRLSFLYIPKIAPPKADHRFCKIVSTLRGAFHYSPGFYLSLTFKFDKIAFKTSVIRVISFLEQLLIRV